MDVLYSVLCEIGEREEVDPVDLQPPLSEVIDAEIVEALANETESRRDSQKPVVEFTYHGYSVRIDGSENVSISNGAESKDDNPQTTAGNSQGNPVSEIRDRERALKKASDIIAARNRPLANRLDGLLEVVRKTLGLESAALSYVDTGTYVFEAVAVAPDVELQAGETVPLAETACKQVVESEQALVLRDVAEEAPELADTAFEVSAYIGVPVFVDGEVYGTFCFYDKQAQDEAFSEWDLGFVELLSRWVSCELELRSRERALQARTSEQQASGS